MRLYQYSDEDHIGKFNPFRYNVGASVSLIRFFLDLPVGINY